MLADLIAHFPADAAITVVQYVAWPQLEIADARFIAVTGEAAELYGAESPEKLCTRFISETRSRSAHLEGQACSILRREGLPAPNNYCSVLTRPDGEEIVTRRLTHQLTDAGGRETWLTFLEQVREGEIGEPPDLKCYGIDEAKRISYGGRYTVSEVLSWSQHNIPQDVPEKLRYTLSRVDCPRKLFDGRVIIARNGTLRYRHICPACAHEWITTKPAPYECPGCRASVRIRKRTPCKTRKASGGRTGIPA